MDKVTVDRIDKAHPVLRSELHQLYVEALELGIDIRFTSVFRSVDEQNELYSIGRRGILGERKVTNAKGGQSYHNYGLACFDDQTRVFTSNGLKYFKDLTVDDEVLTFKDGLLEYQKPTAYISNDYDGEMVNIKTRSVDLCVTPNHKMIAQRKTNRKWDDEWSEILAEDIDYKYRIPCSGDTIHNEQEPPIFNNYNVKIKVKDTRDWWEFMGYYLSEGYSTGTSDGIPRKHNSRYKVSITQCKSSNPEICNKIDECLTRLGFTYSYNGREFAIHNKALWEMLFPIGNSYQMRIPRYMFKANREHLERLYTALVDGDGTWYGESAAYFSVCKGLTEDFAELSILLNKPCAISSRKVKDGTHIMPHGLPLKTFNQQYEARNRTNTTQELRNGNDNYKNISRSYYDGVVYCVTTEAGAVVVERNGKTSVAGNCDICLLLNNGTEVSWDWKADLDEDGESDWMEFVDLAKSKGYVWGGDWRFKDRPHFQKTFGYHWRELIRLPRDRNGYPIIKIEEPY